MRRGTAFDGLQEGQNRRTELNREATVRDVLCVIICFVGLTVADNFISFPGGLTGNRSP